MQEQPRNHQDLVAEAIEQQRIQGEMNSVQIKASHAIDGVCEKLITGLQGTLHPQLASLAIGKACLLAAASFLGISVNMDMQESKLFNEECLKMFSVLHSRKVAEAARVEISKN